jgi:two-component system response regulator DevR
MIRVFLVDDHEVVRRGVAEVIDAEPDLEVIGEAGSVVEARGRIVATQPDVALLDVRLPDGSGVDICRELHSEGSGIHCLILTGYDDDEALYSAVIAGASGYVLKDVRGTKLVESIRKVAAGRSLLDPELKQRLTQRMQSDTHDDPRLTALTVRERQVLALIADGLTNRDIGTTLALAEKTVKNYVTSLLSKLGLQSRTQAAVLQSESRTTEGEPLR